MDLADPFETPLQVVFFLFLVIVNIVLVADIKRRVCKDKVDRSIRERLEQLDAIALMKLIFGQYQRMSPARVNRKSLVPNRRF